MNAPSPPTMEETGRALKAARDRRDAASTALRAARAEDDAAQVALEEAEEAFSTATVHFLDQLS
jgi:hypothetical protein